MRPTISHRGRPADEVVADLRELTHVSYPAGGTALYGPVRDEADVSSLLARLAHLGLSVVDVGPLPD